MSMYGNLDWGDDFERAVLEPVGQRAQRKLKRQRIRKALAKEKARRRQAEYIHKGRPVPEWMPYSGTWPKSGKWYKRQYNKAVRRAARGTGKASAVAKAASECNWKGW